MLSANLLALILAVGHAFSAASCLAAGGVLVVNTEDETTREPIATRMELFRANGTSQIVRTAANAGRGVVISESVELLLPDGDYQFRLIRGPEYRIVNGNFTLERNSQDARTVKLPRMVEMKKEGWMSCDMAVPPKTNDIQLRMMGEDLHFAAIVGDEMPPSMPQAIPENLEPYKPIWLTSGLRTSNDGAIVFYPDANSIDGSPAVQGETAAQMIQRLSANESTRIAVLNPFAWELPIWLATEHIDGLFVLGDWLREDKRIEKIVDGRPPKVMGYTGPRGPGRYAEFIYWNMLEAGLRPAPLAGTVGRHRGTTSAIGDFFDWVQPHLCNRQSG